MSAAVAEAYCVAVSTASGQTLTLMGLLRCKPMVTTAYALMQQQYMTDRGVLGEQLQARCI